MKASINCTELIKHFEGLRTEAYRDACGILTIGYGHTRNVAEGTICTPEQADAWLLEDVALVESDLTHMLMGCPALTQGQWDALVSLGYNTGARRLPVIAPKMWHAIWRGDKTTAAIEMLDINKSAGVVLGGLTERRKEEQKLFLA